MGTMISGLGGPAGYGTLNFTGAPRTGNLDDGFTAVSLNNVFGSTGVNINGTIYNTMYVGTNGLITFNSGVTAYTPAALTSLGQPAIAPFWTDIDLNKGGQIYWAFDTANNRIVITWHNVAPYSGSGTDSFQVVLTNTGAGDMNVDFIYGSIGFTDGYKGNAQVGVASGGSQVLLPGSGVAGALSAYPSTDFSTQDQAGGWSMSFEAGQRFLGDGVVEGTAGNDLIGGSYTGDPEVDRIDGLDANNQDGATGNNDTVLAGAGNDTVQSGLGDDVVYGGSGNDQIFLGQGNDWADGGTENDSIDGGSGNDTIYGGAGDDTLFGGADSLGTTYTATYTAVTTETQSLTGAAGRPNFTVRSISNETLNTGTNNGLTGFNLGNGDSVETHTHTATSQVSGGRIRFHGVSGTETLTITIDGVVQNLATAIANGTVSFNGNGVYQINGAGQIVRIGGGATSTTIGTLTILVPYTSISLASTGTTSSAGMWYEYAVNTQPNDIPAEVGGDDQIYGGDGNDSIDGGNGNDTIHGDAGNDTVNGNVGDDEVWGDAGDDWVYGGAGNDTVYGGSGNDYVSGGTEDDLVYGGLGNDTVFGADGNDTLYGDEGVDILYGGAGNDLAYGGAGIDVLFGESGNDTLYGGDDGDNLYGGTGNDVLSGDAGDDTLQGDDGDDTLFGGTGNDQVYGGLGNDSLAGGDDADSLFGGAGNDTLDGGAGHDYLSGGDGNDLMYGGAGNDTFLGDVGADTIAAGQGMDWVDYSGSTAGVTIDLTAGTASGGYAQGDVLTGVDALLGSAYDDVLLGFDGFSTDPADPYTNIFYGNAGNDYLDGRGGDDFLYGGADNDTVMGGGGNDVVDGGDGDDLLNGGAGADTIYGGADNDTIIVGTGTEPFGDVVFGGDTGTNWDILDLTAWGWARTNVIYDLGNPENGTVEFLDASGAVLGTLTFTGIEQVIPCFTPGTMISTARGAVAVEDLTPGDQVVTRDNGLQDIRWIGNRRLSLADLIVNPDLRPVEITAGALGHGLPLRDMKVSPQHRMLMEGARAEMLFGEAEVLVAATHLTGLAGIAQRLTTGVHYIHVMFDRHEIICANGAWTESFQPAMRSLNSMDEAQRAEITALFPELDGSDGSFPAARLSLKAHEARVLLRA